MKKERTTTFATQETRPWGSLHQGTIVVKGEIPSPDNFPKPKGEGWRVVAEPRWDDNKERYALDWEREV